MTGVGWDALVESSRLAPSLRGSLGVCERPPIRISWDVWEWSAARGEQWMDLAVTYVDLGDGESAEHGLARTVRLLGGLTLMSRELAPGYLRQDVMEVSYRSANKGWYGRVTTVFQENDHGLFTHLLRGLDEMRNG